MASTAKNTSEAGLAKSHLDRNSIANLILLGISAYVAVNYHFAGIFIWIGALLTDDILYFAFGISFFDTEVAVQRGYQFAHVFLNEISGHGRDLGFNLYDGDMDKDKSTSQSDKWKFMMKELELKPGQSLIDIGCGYGDWLNYAKSKGVNAVGVNITPEQAEYARATWGLDVICSNWKDILVNPELQKRLYGKFDAVTFMDTVEHYVPSRYRLNIKEQGKIYTSMFRLANLLLKKDAKPGHVFISCLHQTERKMGLKEQLSCYLLTRYHSGFYPRGDDGLTRWSKTWFEEVERYDRTEDYRITAVVDNNQFQAPSIKWTLTKLLMVPMLFLLDPHHIHKWIDIHTDAWMNLYGDDSYSKEYDAEKRKRVSYVRLWWLTLRRNKTASATAMSG